MTRTSKNPVRYQAGYDIYRRAGIKKATFGKLAAGRWCPQPDIYIGFQPGWAPQRATRWLKETGRIDIYGRPSNADRMGRPRRDEKPPRWYIKAPKRFLTAGEAARLLGRERKIIGRMKSDGYGPQASVVVGELEGYHIDEVVILGEQYGWIEPGGSEVRTRWNEMCRYRDLALKGRAMTAKETRKTAMAAVV